MAERRFIVRGLIFGDEGKGTTVDFLARKFGIRNIVRDNGGTQAGHNIVTESGLHHSSSQFSSGVLIPEVKTYLAAPFLFSPLNLMLEFEELQRKGYADALDRLYIDEDCVLVTPFHALTNRLRELTRGQNRHGSCGKGIGEAVIDAQTHGEAMPRARDLLSPPALIYKLNFLRELKRRFIRQSVNYQSADSSVRQLGEQLENLDVSDLVSEYQSIARRIKIIPHTAIVETIAKGGIIFEGAQGALLDQDFGFFPYITWSRTGFTNSLDLLAQANVKDKPYRLAVMRAYFTRHGNGPLVTEDLSLRQRISACHNTTNDWQGEFRLGWFDLVAARYALECLAGADGLAMTNIDRYDPSQKGLICTGYQLPDRATLEQKQLFVYSGGLAVGIKRRQSVDNLLALTLKQCRPVYAAAPTTYPQQISDLLNVPLAITSFSPDARGKNYLI